MNKVKNAIIIARYKIAQMRANPKSHEMDMCNGPIFAKIVRFAIPLAISSILQLLFNAADVIVVGNFAGTVALAAVGSTGAVTNLTVTLFIGLSVGASVLCSRYYASGKFKDLSETVHTAVAISVSFGVIMIFVGLFVTEPLLTLIGTPDDVFPHAALYMKIIFVGMPASMFYNFGSAILRSVGDTKRPMYFLITAGIINVIVNLILVIVFEMGVAGVGIATILAQYVSAYLLLMCLLKTDGVYGVRVGEIKIYKQKLIEMAKIGLPAGFQGIMFSLSNTTIQSAVNTFNSTIIAGSTAAGNIEGFAYVTFNSIYQAALSFSGQNYGAKKYSRLNKILVTCLLTVIGLGVIVAVIVILFGENLLSVYNSDPDVVTYGYERLKIIAIPYFFCGIMEVFTGMARGLGKSVVPMIVTVLTVCVFRLVWIATAFAFFGTLQVLFASYFISWALTSIFGCFYYLHLRRKLPKVDGE